MIVYTLEQRWEILQHYFENHGNVAECVRKLHRVIGKKRSTVTSFFRYLVEKVKQTAIFIDKPMREKPKTVCTPENIAAMAKSVREAPSIQTLLKPILHKNLGMTSYKVQLV